MHVLKTVLYDCLYEQHDHLMRILLAFCNEEQMSVYGDDKSQLHNGINLAPQRLTDAPIRSNQFEDSPSAYGSCACACPGKASEVEHHCYDVVDETPNGDARRPALCVYGEDRTNHRVGKTPRKRRNGETAKRRNSDRMAERGLR